MAIFKHCVIAASLLIRGPRIAMYTFCTVSWPPAVILLRAIGVCCPPVFVSAVGGSGGERKAEHGCCQIIDIQLNPCFSLVIIYFLFIDFSIVYTL